MARISMVVVVLASGAGLFWGGVWAGCRYPELAAWTGVPKPSAPGTVDLRANESIGNAPASLDQLLQVTRGQVRVLVQMTEELERAERENHIAGNLLRAQGYADDSASVRDQQARKALTKYREDLAEAIQLEKSLVEARTEELESGNRPVIDDKHRAAVRAFFLRRSIEARKDFR